MGILSILFLTMIVVIFFFVGRNKDNTPVLVLVGLILVFINTRLIINYEMGFDPAIMAPAILGAMFLGFISKKTVDSIFKQVY